MLCIHFEDRNNLLRQGTRGVFVLALLLHSEISLVVALSYKASCVQQSTACTSLKDASCTLDAKICHLPRALGHIGDDNFAAFDGEAVSSASAVCISSRAGFLSSATAMTAMVFLMNDETSLASEIPKVSETLQSKRIQATNELSTTVTSATDVDKQRTSPVMESISGFFAGGALTITKTIVKYPLDTASVRLQTNSAYYSVKRPYQLLEDSFRGILTPLVTNVPAGAIFFAVKDATKQALKQRYYDASSGTGMPKWLSTSLAVAVAQIPYWAVRNPSEVVKTRQQAGIRGYGPETNAIDAMKKILDEETLSGLYSGFWENVFYAYPADVIKFICYDALSAGKSVVSPTEGALYGAVSTAVAQLVTTPLDVVRNRVMVRGYNNTEVSQENAPSETYSYLGSIINLARTEGISGLFAGATPRVGKAILSGAIQFATYEETKTSVAKYFSSSK